MKQVSIAILGFGTVGSGVYQVLTEGRDSIRHRELMSVEVKHILVKDLVTEKNIGLAPMGLYTTDITEITSDPEISIVVECMGGTVPAKDFILRALAAGKTVVTSNKEVLAKHWPDFERQAKATGAGLYFEATAGGGVPIIRALLDSMQGNNITRLMGIINGTTNYILTKMTDEGRPYSEVLAEAQKLGYAEANPTADVDGWDCVYKLSILASIAFHARVNIDDIYREGISKVSAEDIAVAKKLGYTIKLLAIGKKMDGNLEVRVHPTMLHNSHPLASVSGVFNGIFLTGDAVGDIMLYGQGAGKLPTASAIVSDVIYAANAHEHRYMTFVNEFDAPQWLVHQKDWLSGYFIRLTASDELGSLSKIAGVLGDSGVSVHSVMQFNENPHRNTAELVFITDPARELSVQSALARLRGLSCVESIDSVMRVEE